MHYSLMLITKEFPTEKVIEKALEPYNEDEFYKLKEENDDIKYPIIQWDWWQIGGRYEGALKLRIDNNDEKYRWKFYSSDGRNGKLFLSHLLTDMKNFAKNTCHNFFTEEDYYQTMGMRDGYLRVDGAFVDDLLDFSQVSCYCCIDKDGNAYTRSYWNGDNYEENDKFDDQLEQVKADSKGCYVTIIDLHD